MAQVCRRGQQGLACMHQYYGLLVLLRCVCLTGTQQQTPVRQRHLCCCLQSQLAVGVVQTASWSRGGKRTSSSLSQGLQGVYVCRSAAPPCHRGPPLCTAAGSPISDALYMRRLPHRASCHTHSHAHNHTTNQIPHVCALVLFTDSILCYSVQVRCC
jgi:hypothetical protein